jgi:hypothetical protein
MAVSSAWVLLIAGLIIQTVAIWLITRMTSD